MADNATASVADIIHGLEPGAMVTKFVVVAEVINSNGERGVWVQTHDDAMRWDSYGLLTEALTNEKAQHIAMRLEGESDE